MGLEAGNPVVGGTVLRRAAIESPNFETGVQGWNIGQNGSAEFNAIVIRGGAVISGTIYIAPSGGDDTATINNALTLPVGEVVLLPGTFTITAPALAGALFGQILRGCGWNTQIHYDGTVVTGGAIQPFSPGARFHVRDLRLTQTAATSSGIAITLTGATDSSVEGVLIDGSTHAPNQGIVMNSSGTHYNVVNRCRINVSGAGCIGIDLDTASNSHTLQDCRILGDANMIGINCNANGILIIRPDIESTALAGIAFGTGALNCELIDGYLQNLTTSITLAAGSGPITITGADLDGSGVGITDNGCVLLSLRGVRDFNGAILNQDRVSSGGADYYAAQDNSASPVKVFQITSSGNVFHRKPCFFSTNVAIGGVSSDFGGAGSALLLEHTTDPTTNPAAGHILLYVDAAGNLQARTSAGNVRLIAAV